MSTVTIINKIQPGDLAELKRTLAGNTTTDTSVINYYKLQKQIGFVNAIGDALAANTTVTLWYSRTPLTTGAEDISDTILPIVDQRWDNCMVFLACFEMTGDEKWEAKYQRELDRMTTLQQGQNNRSFTVKNTGEYE